jgi:hypothetical protein
MTIYLYYVVLDIIYEFDLKCCWVVMLSCDIEF